MLGKYASHGPYPKSSFLFQQILPHSVPFFQNPELRAFIIAPEVLGLSPATLDSHSTSLSSSCLSVVSSLGRQTKSGNEDHASKKHI